MTMIKKTKKKVSKPRKAPPLWNVLAVEDDFKTRIHLVKSLSKIARCQTAVNGEEALSLYHQSIRRKEPFDFIILDVTIPLIDGFDVLKTIRKSEEEDTDLFKKPARVIMLTAYKDSLMEMYNMGWDEYFTKPVDVKKLISKMKELMEKADAE